MGLRYSSQPRFQFALVDRNSQCSVDHSKLANRRCGRMGILADGKLVNRKTHCQHPITETPDDLKLLARDAEEYSFFDLQKQIGDMKTKGIDTTAIEVDLQSKLAFQLVSLLMVLLATPFAIKRQLSNNVSLSFGIAMVIGFRLLGTYRFLPILGPQRRHSSATAAWIPNLFSP